MKKVIVTKEAVEGYLNYLKAQEKSQGTLEKYRRELYELMFFLSDTEVRKEELLLWKGALEKKYCPSGVNGRLVAANGFFTFLGRFDLRMKLLRIQREIFSNEEKELTRAEYGKLVRTAEKKGELASGAGDSDHLFHRYPCFGIVLYYGRGSEKRTGRGKLQRKTKGDFSSAGVAEKTDSIWKEEKN